MKLTVLITNRSLSAPTGTEVYAQDLAIGLRKAGHLPILYSPRLGPLAAKIRRETIPVVDDLNQLGSAPNIIHGQHLDETATALLRFPRTPAIYVCHDWYYATDVPPKFPRVLRYVAVDAACRDRLVCEQGVPEDRVTELLEFIDLERFQPRPPLPAKPQRALILCNQTKENAHLNAARAACERRGLSLDVYGLGVNQLTDRPEDLIPQYDVVLAKGRAALEALAVGTAVVVYWWRRLGPLVTTAKLDQLRPDNFGLRTMGPELTPKEFEIAIEDALAAYDPADAARASARVRAEAGSDSIISAFVSLYESVILEHGKITPDPEAEARAAASYARQLSLRLTLQREELYQTTPYLFGERVRRMPFVGRLARAATRRFVAGTQKRNGRD